MKYSVCFLKFYEIILDFYLFNEASSLKQLNISLAICGYLSISLTSCGAVLVGCATSRGPTCPPDTVAFTATPSGNVTECWYISLSITFGNVLKQQSHLL